MAGGVNTFRSSPPHTSQIVSGSSVNGCQMSNRWPQLRHAYSYVGIRSEYTDGPLHDLRICEVAPTGRRAYTRVPMGSSPKVKKAVIPAAGLGTRFLPATKA